MMLQNLQVNQSHTVTETRLSVYLSGFSTQHHTYMLSSIYAIARPSVRLSDGWIMQKMVKVRDHEIFTIW